jgi:hypothetical protein
MFYSKRILIPVLKKLNRAPRYVLAKATYISFDHEIQAAHFIKSMFTLNKLSLLNHTDNYTYHLL